METEVPIVEFFKQNYRSLLKITIMMLHDYDSAQDVLHNVAVSIYAKRDTLADISNPQAYLFTCLRRAVLNYIRDNARSLPTDPEELETLRSDPKNKAALDYAEWDIILRKHLERYSEELTQAFIDHYMKEYPLEQLATRLEVAPNSLSQQFRRMRIKIAKNSPNMTLFVLVFLLK